MDAITTWMTRMILERFPQGAGAADRWPLSRRAGIGLGLTIALLVGFYLVFVTVIGWVVPESFTLPWIGEITWVDNALTWASVPLMLLVEHPDGAGRLGLHLDVPGNHRRGGRAQALPHLPPARSIGIVEGLVDALEIPRGADRREPSWRWCST
jgi:CysZ protein